VNKQPETGETDVDEGKEPNGQAQDELANLKGKPLPERTVVSTVVTGEHELLPIPSLPVEQHTE